MNGYAALDSGCLDAALKVSAPEGCRNPFCLTRGMGDKNLCRFRPYDNVKRVHKIREEEA